MSIQTNLEKKESGHKFYASACSGHDGNWLKTLDFSETNNIEDADVIIFGGGADIEPSTYGEEKGSNTHTSPQRETQERADFKKGMELGKKFFGICRGHQLLCAMAGGKLIQHVSNHSGDHNISTSDRFVFRTNSIHHQMINPYNLDSKKYKILAWSEKPLSKVYMGGKGKIWLPVDFKEIEAIYFPQINAMGVQYHPEMMYGNHYDGILDWTRKSFLKFFNNEL